MKHQTLLGFIDHTFDRLFHDLPDEVLNKPLPLNLSHLDLDEEDRHGPDHLSDQTRIGHLIIRMNDLRNKINHLYGRSTNSFLEWLSLMSEELALISALTPYVYDQDGNQIYPSSVELDDQDEIMDDENEIMDWKGEVIKDDDGKPLNLVPESLPFTLLDSSDNPIEVTVYRAA